jgi:hypothetical protein
VAAAKHTADRDLAQRPRAIHVVWRRRGVCRRAGACDEHA